MDDRANREPGFGPPLEDLDWQLLILIGGSVLGSGLIVLLLGGDLGVGIIAGVGGLALLGVSRYLYDIQQLQAQPVPIMARADLTARVLTAIEATTQDLALNRQHGIAPAQGLRLEMRGVAEPPVHVAEGPVTLIPYRDRRRGYALRIGDILFTHTTAMVLNAMKHQVVYRLYFVEIPPTFPWTPPARVILSAEALSDG